MEHVNPTGDLLAEAARPADSVAVEAHRRGDGREAMSVENPWREFIENCINGDNYFRAREYMELLADLDRGYAAEMEVERLRSRLAEADVCLHSTRVTLIEVAEHSDFEEGAEFGVRSCCHVRDYRPHAESCAVMRAISNIDAFLAREQNHE
jgi:hypothetical protein